MVVFYLFINGTPSRINSDMTQWLKKSDFSCTYNITLHYHAGKCQIKEGLNVNLNGKSLLEIQVLYELVWMVKQMATNFVYQNSSSAALCYRFFTP